MSQTTIKRPPYYTERGERFYTRIIVDLQRPNPRECHHHVITAPDGKGFDQQFIWETVSGCGEKLAKDYPNEQYDLVVTAPNEYKFVYGGTVEYVQ